MSALKDRHINMPKSKLLLLPVLLSMVLTACSDDDEGTVITLPEPTEQIYQITVTNLTNAQPFSPLGVTLHNDAPLWAIGESASVALEKLAEGGDHSELLVTDNVYTSASAESPTPPGNSTTITVTTTEEKATHLSLITMLVNTNDAFTGLTNIALSTLTVDVAKSWNVAAYDAGTESNSEAAGTMPGPADGGTGYSSVRDDVVDFVARHNGVVTQDDGLTQSVLTQAHRFDNPTMKVTITRKK